MLEGKLVGLFKAIYAHDPNMQAIAKDAFECMKQQKISGNICPHIKKAIQECLKMKKEAINKTWYETLLITVDGEQMLQKVEDDVDAYGRILIELVNAYKLYDESVDTIVDVWKEMLNSSDELKKTFYLLIMTEFVETIWDDENIKMLIQEIFQHQDKFERYQEEIDQLLEIDKNLQEIKRKCGGSKADTDTQSTWSDGSNNYDSDCHNCKSSHGRKKPKPVEVKPKK